MSFQKNPPTHNPFMIAISNPPRLGFSSCMWYEYLFHKMTSIIPGVYTLGYILSCIAYRVSLPLLYQYIFNIINFYLSISNNFKAHRH